MHAIETLILCQIIAYNSCCCISIVKRDHRTESLRSTGVPDVKLNLGTIWESYTLLKICTTYGHMVTLREDVFAVALRDAWFADSTVSQKDNFCLDNARWALILWRAICRRYLMIWISLLHMQWVYRLSWFLWATRTTIAPRCLLCPTFIWFH
jgi:hypothetical protein